MSETPSTSLYPSLIEDMGTLLATIALPFAASQRLSQYATSSRLAVPYHLTKSYRTATYPRLLSTFPRIVLGIPVLMQTAQALIEEDTQAVSGLLTLGSAMVSECFAASLKGGPAKILALAAIATTCYSFYEEGKREGLSKPFLYQALLWGGFLFAAHRSLLGRRPSPILIKDEAAALARMNSGQGTRFNETAIDIPIPFGRLMGKWRDLRGRHHTCHFVIRDAEDRILLTRDKKAHLRDLRIPSGGREQGEEFLDAVGRELNEELGLTAGDIARIQFSHLIRMRFTHPSVRGWDYPFTHYVFGVTLAPHSKLRAGGEIADIQWVKRHDFLRDLLHNERRSPYFGSNHREMWTTLYRIIFNLPLR